MAVECHLYLPQLRMSMDGIVERAAAAERTGFTGIALMDHLAPPGALDAPMFEAIVSATWLAARTERLAVGHLVLCDAFRHPALLAKQAVTLDHASGGRFELGLGWGSMPDEIEAYGIGDVAPRVRVARLAETLEVLQRLWSGETVNYQGLHHTLRDVRPRPTPLRHIPIVIGGTGPRTLDLVAAYADWWNLPVTALEHLDRLRPRAGKARVSVQQLVTVISTEAERTATVATALRRFGPMAGENGMVVGNVRELTAHFRALADRGVERFYTWFTDFAPTPTLEIFGEVIAALR
ncbi:LLM class flavin-dependent oxidoreductase [Frankia sp. Cas3]|uniref:LLM class flavin-dependent oxidoreductase n=1 Tax=Frankia sp. Cas3 TaxID=3073926 RepID=UPI002AD32E0F|nr:LLM class flavin-dependent oxidoreductase [Frankia sp. Cas3]